MEWELMADAEAVNGLGRSKPFVASRSGRAKTQPIRIVWHDSPDHALLQQGLALAEQRGLWRLERAVPGTDTWLPGQPAPVVTDAPDLASLPSPLAPLAAFEGSRATSVHHFADAEVTLTIEKGILRTVAAEHPVARIYCQGEAAPIRAAALMLANAIPISVPRASLPAEAIGLAIGRSPPPRHRGAPVLPERLTTPVDALTHILGHLIDVILANAPLTSALDDAGTEAVHQMRVAVRRARSALSVFRAAVSGSENETGALEAINTTLKILGHRLGPSRDWDVFVTETLPQIQPLLPDDPRLERLVTAAMRRRREHRTRLTAYLNGADFRNLAIELAWRVTAGSLQLVPPDDQPAMPEDQAPPVALNTFSAAVLQHRWKKLLAAGKQMDALDVPGLHGVRLRAKRARYAAEMFSTLYHGKPAHRFIRRLSDLQQCLGVLNDGAVATQLLDELGGSGGRHAYAVGLVTGFMAARINKIRPDIMLAFEKFRRQSAYWT